MFLKLLKLFKFFYKQFYIKLWRKVYSKKGNVHLSSNTKQIIKIPFTKNKVWIRPSVSDTGRVREYLSKIYFKANTLTKIS